MQTLPVVVFAVCVAIVLKLHTVPTIDILHVSVSTDVTLNELLEKDNGKLFDENRLTRLGLDKLIGPESVVEDPDNPEIYYGGTADGRIVKVNGNTGLVEDFTFTGGRPLGIHVLPDNNSFGDIKILVAEALYGLIAVDRNGRITILSNSVNSTPIRYANDLDIDFENNIVYFTDCSGIPPIFDYSLQQWSTMKAALFDIISGYPSGRLLKYDFNTKETTILLDNIAYANGVALSKDKDFILISETGRYSFRKLWITGPKSGQWEYIIKGLPILPDGISLGNDNTFWFSGFTRSPIVDFFHKIPFLKKFLLRLFLDKIFLVDPYYGIVIQIDKEGKILQSIHDPEGKLLSNISSVSQSKNNLLIGGLKRNFMAKYSLI